MITPQWTQIWGVKSQITWDPKVILVQLKYCSNFQEHGKDVSPKIHRAKRHQSIFWFWDPWQGYTGLYITYTTPGYRPSSPWQRAYSLRSSLNCIYQIVPLQIQRFGTDSQLDETLHRLINLSMSVGVLYENSQKWLFVDGRSKLLLWPGSRWLPLASSHRSLQQREKQVRKNYNKMNSKISRGWKLKNNVIDAILFYNTPDFLSVSLCDTHKAFIHANTQSLRAHTTLPASLTCIVG